MRSAAGRHADVLIEIDKSSGNLVPPEAGGTDYGQETVMRSIAVMNQKGGVGKTTTAVNLSAALAEAGRSVFVLDLDPQAHASLHLGVTVRDGQASMYDVLTGDVEFHEVRQQVGDNIHLAP